jgi:hypothetical protein
VINPNHVGIVNGDRVSSPDVLGVDISDGDVSVRVSYSILTTNYWQNYWMIMLLAPLTIRRPLPLITPLDPDPRSDLLDLTVIPRTPALSLQPLVMLMPETQQLLTR